MEARNSYEILASRFVHAFVRDVNRPIVDSSHSDLILVEVNIDQVPLVYVRHQIEPMAAVSPLLTLLRTSETRWSPGEDLQNAQKDSGGIQFSQWPTPP